MKLSFVKLKIKIFNNKKFPLKIRMTQIPMKILGLF